MGHDLLIMDGTRSGRVLSICAALSLALAWPCTAADRYVRASVDEAGHLRILTSEGRTITISKDGEQVGFAQIAISADRASVGYPTSVKARVDLAHGALRREQQAQDGPSIGLREGCTPRAAAEAQSSVAWSTKLRGGGESLKNIEMEPRFLLVFSAHKAHLNFAPTAAGLEPFRKELEKHKTTKGTLQIPPTSPCQRIWFARWLSTVSGMCVNVKTSLSGNSIPAGMDGLFGLSNVGRWNLEPPR